MRCSSPFVSGVEKRPATHIRGENIKKKESNKQNKNKKTTWSMIGWRESGERNKSRHTHTYTQHTVEGEMKYDGGGTHQMGVGDEGRFLQQQRQRERPLQNGKHLPGCWPFSHIKKRKLLCLILGVAVEIKRAQGPHTQTHKKMSIPVGRRRRR